MKAQEEPIHGDGNITGKAADDGGGDEGIHETKFGRKPTV